MEAFTFGEPSPVLDRRDILDYVECISNGNGTSRRSVYRSGKKPARRRSSQLPIYVKRNILTSTLSLTRCCHSRISAALCWISWCSAMRF
jgi:capsid portal protein